MRMTNLLHFTENHRFNIHRDFSLSPLDLRMISIIYQPMVGAYATSLYLLLNQQLPAERIGYTAADQLRKLFLALGIEPNERGRKLLVEQCSKLEAVGLLHTFRTELSQTEEYIYEFRLSEPLKPIEFFQTQHLLLLLRDKIGKYPVMALRSDLEGVLQPDVDDPYGIREELSMPFYEIFLLDSQNVDLELEQVSTMSRTNEQIPMSEQKEEERLQYGHIIRRFPKNSANRPHVEKLKDHEDDLVLINYLAEKYRLTLKEMCQLLDEEGVFNAQGKLLGDQLEHKANETFLQSRKREENVDWSSLSQADSSRNQTAVTQDANTDELTIGLKVPEWLVEQYDSSTYNKMLSSEPHTQVLRILVAPNISRPTLNLFSKLNLYYHLPDAVLNVLVHHMRTTKLPWKENYIEKMAASLQGEQILTFAQAVEYFHKESEARSGVVKSSGSNNKKKTGFKEKTTQKPKIPIFRATEQDEPLTAEAKEEIKQKMRQFGKVT
jgi:replication initiation and membrane attachment protein